MDHALRAVGWKPFFEQQISPALFETAVIARVSAERCRFSDCNHSGDAGCAVQAALESGELDERRFANFQKLMAEQAHNSRTLAERHERG